MIPTDKIVEYKTECDFCGHHLYEGDHALGVSTDGTIFCSRHCVNDFYRDDDGTTREPVDRTFPNEAMLNTRIYHTLARLGQENNIFQTKWLTKTKFLICFRFEVDGFFYDDLSRAYPVLKRDAMQAVIEVRS